MNDFYTGKSLKIFLQHANTNVFIGVIWYLEFRSNNCMYYIFYEFTSFSIFWPNQKIRIKILQFSSAFFIFHALHYASFSGIFYNICAPSTQYLEFGIWALLGRIVDEIKNNKSYTLHIIYHNAVSLKILSY